MNANAARNKAVRIERISSFERLSELGPQWDRIQRQCPYKHVLLDYRWVCKWLEIFARDSQLTILVLWVDEIVVGIVPLLISKSYELFPSRDYHVHTAYDYQYTRLPRWLRWAPVRRLSFPLSVAMANRRAHFLFADDDPLLYEQTMNYVASIANEWDLLVLEGFPSGSTPESLLLNAIGTSGLAEDGRRYDRESMFATLPESMDAFLASKRKHFRQRMRASCRQALQRFPELQLREHRGPQIGEGMTRLFELEGRSWKVNDKRSRTYHIGQTEELLRFHREVAQAFALTDSALVLTMDIGERSVAAIYCVERDGVLAAIVTYMDEEFSRQLTTAPMFQRLVEICIERGLNELDFNGKTALIEKWANGTRLSSRYFVYNQHFYSRFLYLLSRSAYLLNATIRPIRQFLRDLLFRQSAR